MYGVLHLKLLYANGCFVYIKFQMLSTDKPALKYKVLIYVNFRINLPQNILSNSATRLITYLNDFSFHMTDILKVPETGVIFSFS